MPNKETLAERMKRYESVSSGYLTRRLPVILRLDGKAFHSFTKGFDRPFDSLLMMTMQTTMKMLCESIQGCVLGYTQSDEITLILCDYQTLDTQPWFGYRIQKMTSVSAAAATLYFNTIFSPLAMEYIEAHCQDDSQQKRIQALKRALHKEALFDSRVFSIPKEEVNNCLVWRQQDAIRNSIEATAQANFSPKQIHGLNCTRLKEKLLTEKNIDWNAMPIEQQRGSCCIRKLEQHDGYVRNGWIIDSEIPVFSKNPEYVSARIRFEDE
ncbi:MAG: tRNA(His) guanylyltransferase Thg1 family protein [Oscillospiraceae bacterium]|nr:tRNA(His) guanylyltransferase Thg1 family protein [Oscillospiraceae bacterium]